MPAIPPSDAIAAMLAEAGLPAEFQIADLPGGANNRVYRLEGPSGAVLLKVYFQHPDDARDRLGAEFQFSRFAWQRGVRCLPRPLAMDRAHGAAIYEFIEGRRPRCGEIGMPEVQQAARFLRELNRRRSDPAARLLPRASEACFTLEEHLLCVDGRIERLGRLDPAGPAGSAAIQFVREELAPCWRRIRLAACFEAERRAVPLRAPIPPQDEWLSPSDFGFHNAILDAGGRLRFIDFEYAGWDDPAKTVCDFFCQPAVPTPKPLAEHFARSTLSELSDPDLYYRRAALLMPVYRVKWCCIMLNEFLPPSALRRAFAGETRDQEDRNREQLRKARDALRQIDPPKENQDGLY